MNRERVETLFPYLSNALFILHLGRAPLLVIALFKPSICHYFYYYQCFMVIIKEAMPIDVGQDWKVQTKNEFLLWFAFLYIGDLKYEMIAALTKIIYVHFFVQFYIYDMDKTPEKALQECAFGIMSNFCAYIGVILFYKWAGNLFLDAEMQSESNKGLLNDLKEGVFIVSQEDYSIKFFNEAAKSINHKFVKRCGFELSSQGFLQHRQRIFQKIDHKVIKFGDCERILEMLDNGSEEVSLKWIINEQLDSNSEV